MSFLEQNTLYIVLIISLMIWIGIFVYMLTIDKKIAKLEKMISLDNQANSENLQNKGVKNE